MITLLIGLPGSGKTYYSQKLEKTEPNTISVDFDKILIQNKNNFNKALNQLELECNKARKNLIGDLHITKNIDLNLDGKIDRSYNLIIDGLYLLKTEQLSILNKLCGSSDDGKFGYPNIIQFKENKDYCLFNDLLRTERKSNSQKLINKTKVELLRCNEYHMFPIPIEKFNNNYRLSEDKKRYAPLGYFKIIEVKKYDPIGLFMEKNNINENIVSREIYLCEKYNFESFPEYINILKSLNVKLTPRNIHNFSFIMKHEYDFYVGYYDDRTDYATYSCNSRDLINDILEVYPSKKKYIYFLK